MIIPKKPGPLLALAQTIASAITEHQAAALLPADAGAAMDAAIAALTNAVNAHNDNCGALGVLRTNRNVAENAGDEYLANAITSLKPYIGRHWNAGWRILGFSSGSLELPASREERFEILSALPHYLTTHPGQEAAGVQITAAHLTAVADAIIDARAALNGGIAKCKVSAAAIVQASGVVQQRIRVVETMLGLTLGPADATWNAFGFPLPITKRLPIAPATLEIQQTGPGTVIARWSRSVRASRYRLFVQAPGEEEARAVASVKDLLAELADLPMEVKLTFTVIAANTAGESSPGAPVEFTLK